MPVRHTANNLRPFASTSPSRAGGFDHGARKEPRYRRFRSKQTLRSLMTSSVVTTRPEQSVQRAARLISEQGCGALPVVDGSGRLIGIISNGDIARRLVARGLCIEHAQVSDCMTDKAFACPADNSIETCMRAMSWHQVKRMPVVDEDHRVIGIICKRDLARYLCEHADPSEGPSLAELIWALG